MINWKSLHLVALASVAVVLFFLFISSTATASIVETRITTHGTASDPDIYGNTIVWRDTRNGNSAIYAMDLSNKKETLITGESDQINPAVYGNKVVYVLNNTVYIYDLSTHKKTSISNGDFDSVAIYENKIIINSQVGIWMHDISTQQTTEIYSRSGYETGHPAIYGNNVVWEGNPGENGFVDIYKCNLSTSKKSKISNSKKAYNPEIFGNKIVWQEKHNGNFDIYMYDLSTTKETKITTNSSDSINPVISGNNIVWQDNRNGNWNIYAYDLITHQQIHTTHKSNQVTPAIYGNKIVWTDYRNGQYKPDVYMGTISYLPVSAFTASPTTGKHPLDVKFSDKSTDAYYWYWNFGDKSNSKLQSPVHKYTNAGRYTVTLKVTNAAGSSTKTMSIKVNNLSQLPIPKI